MNSLSWIFVKEDRPVTRNPHFWVLILFILLLATLYYSEQIFSETPQWFWRLVVFEFNNDLHGSLFCIPFVYAALVFWWRGTLLTWLVSMMIIAPRIVYYTPDINSLITNIFLLLIPLLVVIILTLQIKWRESEKQAARELEKERRAYIARIFRSQEEERTRISREVHDDTTQRLWIVANDIQNLSVNKMQGMDAGILGELSNIKDTVLNITEDTKRLSLALRPGILDDLGLIPAIRWLGDQLNRDDSFHAKVSVEGKPRQQGQEINNHLFRITQEALNNVRRHARATSVDVRLIFTEETIRLEIRDNGIGFSNRSTEHSSKQERLGIIGMRERAKLLEGVLQIDSKPNRGTVISVELKA